MKAQKLKIVSTCFITIISLSSCSEIETFRQFGDPEISKMQFSREDFEGICNPVFLSETSPDSSSNEDRIYSLYQENYPFIRQKISFRFDHESASILQAISEETLVSSNSTETENSNIFSIKINGLEIYPETFVILADNPNKRIWELELFFSQKEMPFGKLAQANEISVHLKEQTFHIFQFSLTDGERTGVNECLDQTLQSASEYFNLREEVDAMRQDVSSGVNAGPTPECSAVVIRRSLSVGSDGTESERCFPAFKAGEPPICETPVEVGTILRPSQIWLKDGVKVSVCEHGGNCYPANSVKFDPSCDDPRSVGYFEVE